MIRRALALSPVAAFATGCVSQPWTPSVEISNYAQEPDLRATNLPSRDEVMRRWQLPQGDPWAPYAKYTLVSALDSMPRHVELPDVNSLDDVERARAAAMNVARLGVPAGTLFVVDMRGAASVAFGVMLSQATGGQVSLVPTFNNWPADDEFVPAEETLAAMASMAPYVDASVQQGTTPVFLLDAWRLAYRDESPGDDTYDNRYILSSSDLPDAATLRAHGISQVVYVVESLDETTLEEDDLHLGFMEWQSAGIRIAMVDLDVLERPLPPEGWGVIFDEDVLLVQPRITLIEEPGFYIRAHGGFGGIHARPGGGWIFHGGWGGGHHGGGG